ncbi:MAG TPA: M15 family metallopeptidase [Fimbriimonas sp.]
MKPPSPSEPVSELRRIPIRECGEPLVDFLSSCPDLAHERPRFDYRRETLMRDGLLERLCRSANRLPPGLRLGVIEGWRAPVIQQRMYRAVWKQMCERYPDKSPIQLRRIVNRFSAPMDRRAPPPHTTGGAVDLALLNDRGEALDLHSPFDLYDDRGFPFSAAGLSPEAARNRSILAEALLAEGITNYPSEYWHWSYGDQGWAYRGGHPEAVYGALTPDGWEPDPRDVTDAPLEFVRIDR